MQRIATPILAAILVLAAGCASAPSAQLAGVEHRTTSEVADASRPLPASGLLSSGQPDAAVLDRVAAAGYTTVVDLRTDAEERGIDERAEVERRGMRYVSLPIESLDDVNPANAALLMQAIEDAGGPVLMHCASGNRVGSLLAVGRFEQGASVDEAMAVGKQGGLTRWTPGVRKRLESGN